MVWKLTNFAKNTALITENEQEISYNELDTLCAELACVIKKRALVFQLCKNSLGSIVGYLTFLNNKHVPLLLNANIQNEQLSELLEEYQPEYIYLPKEEASRVEGEIHFEKNGYLLIKTKYLQKIKLYDELALLLNTSGSTGSAKLVRLSYENLLANTESIVEYLKLSPLKRAITNLPMSYTYGLSIINTHLYTGASLVLTDKSVLESAFWNLMKKYEVDSLAGVPYTYELFNRLDIYSMDLPSLKTLTQAGGRILPALHKKFATWAIENKKEFIVMYGQTEATSRMGYLPFERTLEKFGKMGIAIPRGEFSLVDENQNTISAYDLVGELVYKGKNVSLGYAEKKEDLVKADENKGLLFTGDMATCDEDGFYTIVGRKKRFLKLFGHRVNLDEVERAIQANLNINNACAGLDDLMYIFVTEDKKEKEIKDFVSDYTKIHFSAFKVLKIEQIPTNDSGKKQYKELTQYYKAK